MDPDNARPLALAYAAPPAGPRILQLSSLLGNVYDMDQYYYNPAANVSQGNFGAVLAFALAHGHPVVVHECLDIYAFQAAHPSAVVHPLNKNPPAILAWGLLLLSNAQPFAPLAIDQSPPAVTSAPLTGDQQFVLHKAPLSSMEARTPSDTSSALLTYQSGAGLATFGGDLPSGFILLLSASGFPLPCPQQSSCRASLTSKFLVFPLHLALLVLIPMVWMSLHLLWGAVNINDMVLPMGGLHGTMGGLAPSIMPSAYLLLVQRLITGIPMIFQGAFLWRSLLLSPGVVHQSHLMGGLPMRLHLWHLCLLLRLIRCIL
jgi:hypothetical protein